MRKIDRAGLANALNATLSKEGSGFVCEPLVGKNVRMFVCNVEGCGRPAYARGFCNAHYLRVRSGKPLDPKIVNRRRLPACIDCGCQTNSKGGWGRCSKHYKSRRKTALKTTAVEFFGGKCADCDNNFHLSVYDFHHERDKMDAPSSVFVNCSAEVIASELASCVLLCANCHRMRHYGHL